jgi:type VI secretion system protein ImpH
VYEFHFAQVVRILHKLAPQKEKVGTRDDPAQDPLLFKAQVSFGVSSSDVHDLTMLPTPTLTVSFTGIAGIQGPLPSVFTEMVVERMKAKDFATRDFLDIFNHRLMTFWYTLYGKVYPGLLDTPMEKTPIGQALMDLGGVRFHTEGAHMAPLGTLFWQRPPSARGLEKAIVGFFNLPCRIVPFEGGWNEVNASEYTLLGRRFQTLGVDTMLGSKSYDQGAGFRLVLGPLSYTEFQDFLPSTQAESGLNRLKSLVDAYFDAPPSYKIELLLKREDVPAVRLSGEYALSRNAWLNARGNIKTHGHTVIKGG